MKNSNTFTRCLIAGCVVLLSVSTHAQFAYNYIRAADDFYRKGDYFSAAENYEKYLTGNTKGKDQNGFDPYAVGSASKGQKAKVANRKEVVYKTAESYRMLSNYPKAEPYYKEATQFGAEYPLARYWYAKSLRENSKFDEAETEMSQFLKDYTTEDAYRTDADKELKNLQFRRQEMEKKDINLYTVNKLPVNTQGANAAPSVNSNMLLFNSTRPDGETRPQGDYLNKLYQAAMDGTSATKIEISQGSNEHYEAPSVTPDGSRLYFTKWAMVDGKKVANIYMSAKKGPGWSDPTLATGLNSDGSSSQQPNVTADGKQIYFASDKGGGYGKMDLYVASLNADGSAGEVTNLGSAINTAEDDEAPYYYAPEGVLVFATNGRVGMGGFDLYQAKRNDNGWDAVTDMGYPINSVRDDKYFASVGSKHLLDTVYFSSRRSTECCFELFVANKARPKKILGGKIIDCLTAAPMPNVSITASDPANEAPVSSGTTDAFGRYQVSVDQDQDVKVTAEAPGYTTKVINIKRTDPTDTLINVSVCLEPPEKPFEAENKPVVIPNIYFDYDSSTLRPESYPVIDSVVGLMERYPTMAIEVSGHTDNRAGEDYNQRLSEARAKAFVDYVISKGIDPKRMEWKGYGESRPIAPNEIKGKDNPEGRQKNRRTEIRVIHY